MNPPDFFNPYKGVENLPTGERFRFQSHVPEERFNYFKALRLKQGTIIITVNTLIEKLYHELNRRGVKDLTNRQQFEQFVINCKLVLPDEIVPDTYESRGVSRVSLGSTPINSDGSNVNRTASSAFGGGEKIKGVTVVSSSSKKQRGAGK